MQKLTEDVRKSLLLFLAEKASGITVVFLRECMRVIAIANTVQSAIDALQVIKTCNGYEADAKTELLAKLGDEDASRYLAYRKAQTLAQLVGEWTGTKLTQEQMYDVVWACFSCSEAKDLFEDLLAMLDAQNETRRP